MRTHVVLLTSLFTGLVTLSACGSYRPEPGPDVRQARETPVQVVVFDVVWTSAQRFTVTPQTEPVDGGSAGGDPVLTALRTLLRHQPARGHESLWTGMCRPGPDVAAVDTGDPVVVTLADFPPDDTAHAVCDLSQEGWQAQRQQVAWTVGAALGRDVAVRVVDGSGREVLPDTRPERTALAEGALGGAGVDLGWSTGR